MKVFKEGGHRLFERDPECAEIVSKMLLDLEKPAWMRCASTARSSTTGTRRL